MVYRVTCTECNWDGRLRMGKRTAVSVAGQHHGATDHVIRIQAVAEDEVEVLGDD